MIIAFILTGLTVAIFAMVLTIYFEEFYEK